MMTESAVGDCYSSLLPGPDIHIPPRIMIDSPLQNGCDSPNEPLWERKVMMHSGISHVDGPLFGRLPVGRFCDDAVAALIVDRHAGLVLQQYRYRSIG